MVHLNSKVEKGITGLMISFSEGDKSETDYNSSNKT